MSVLEFRAPTRPSPDPDLAKFVIALKALWDIAKRGADPAQARAIAAGAIRRITRIVESEMEP